MKIGEKVHIYEFLGCAFHGCACGKGEKDEDKRTKQMSDWKIKKELLEQRGELHAIWECEWKAFVASNPQVSKTITKFPHIMKSSETEIELIQAIKDRTFYGFIECDLW